MFNYYFFLPRQGENADENEAVLDDEMEKAFFTTSPSTERFDVRKLSGVRAPSSSLLDKDNQNPLQTHPTSKYNEQEIECK